MRKRSVLSSSPATSHSSVGSETPHPTRSRRDRRPKVKLEQKRFKTGMGFLVLIHEVEGLCSGWTENYLKNAGKKAPRTYRHLGTLLSLLYQYSMCAWGCAKGDHTVEHLTARAITSSMAALALMKRGYYDDALALVRRVGELANLLFLFSNDEAALTQWKGLTQEGRWAQLGFERVRQRLQDKGVPIPMKVPEYREMGARGTHGTATTMPASYSAGGPAIVGPGIPQGIPALIILNHVSEYILWIALALLSLSTPPKAKRAQLIKAIGALNTHEPPRVLRRARYVRTAMPAGAA